MKFLHSSILLIDNTPYKVDTDVYSPASRRMEPMIRQKCPAACFVLPLVKTSSVLFTMLVLLISISWKRHCFGFVLSLIFSEEIMQVLDLYSNRLKFLCISRMEVWWLNYVELQALFVSAMSQQYEIITWNKFYFMLLIVQTLKPLMWFSINTQELLSLGHATKQFNHVDLALTRDQWDFIINKINFTTVCDHIAAVDLSQLIYLNLIHVTQQREIQLKHTHGLAENVWIVREYSSMWHEWGIQPTIATSKFFLAYRYIPITFPWWTSLKCLYFD